MPRSLTGDQRKAAKRRLAAKRGTSAAPVYPARPTGALTLADCPPSPPAGGSRHDSGGGYDSGGSPGGSSGGGGSSD